MKYQTRKLTVMAMLIAVSVILVYLVRFPLIPGVDFLEYDPADISILIGTFAFGPVSGLLITIVAAVIQGLTVSAKSGIYGIIMHIVATGTFVIVAGCIYRWKRTFLGALLALICGALAMTLIMLGANLVVTPLFLGTPVDVVKGMLLPIILPFNLAKAGINALITLVVYKPISVLIHKASDHPIAQN
ncbi:MAG: ECF transporter S component [Oscillospiraceae bacterium]|jgi:riboflavin transporter FmnP|nr:ECF transporter S component [Oscillospiraceae bacterium]